MDKIVSKIYEITILIGIQVIQSVITISLLFYIMERQFIKSCLYVLLSFFLLLVSRKVIIKCNTNTCV